ncbi:MAG: twin-arginine translocase TatA/TatE family subunit [Candidatus Heimdallarchaeota archaeon]
MAFIGWPELVLILIIIIFIFGASRITGLGKALGKAVREYREASSGEEKKGKRVRKKKRE